MHRPDDRLALYKRPRAPMEVYRCHGPMCGRAQPPAAEGPRNLESWDGFARVPQGSAPDLAAAERWAAGRASEVASVQATGLARKLHSGS